MVAAIAAGSLATSGTASADLPARSPQEVLVLLQQADVEAFSGTLRTSVDLGLPDLGALVAGSGRGDDDETAGGGPGADLLDLLTGDNTVRIWVDGPERLRAQLLEPEAETNVVRDGAELWVYRSADATATRVDLPVEKPDPPPVPSTATPPTPQVLADRVVVALDPTTEVSAGEPVVVAGRGAYELRLSPDDPRSLVRTASIAVDAETGAALRVRVEARGQDEPAVDVGWTSWSPERPDAETFRFTPPPGATVEELDAGSFSAGAGARPGGLDQGDAPAGSPRPQVIGTGWTAVLEIPAPAEAGDDALPGSPHTDDRLAALLTPVEGGAVLRTSLLSALRTDDGRWYVGAVTVETLQAVAGGR